ncbi:MAG TPA: VIT1/CCC1 transporter family protein, partial [Candidatus Eisenbacteria bacterium]|nr:VIT1/CCC1 transporter family protein [Candidatus Eisenbacteria bacterium]
AFDHHKNHQEEHRIGNPLRDVILGGQDGMVNALGIVLGVAAAGGNAHILVLTVLAASAAEAISMGAVAYTSAVSQRDYYEAELIKEKKEIEMYPEMEKEEVRRIFEQKGFKGKVLEEIVATIVSDKKIWTDTMMREELGIEKVETRNIFRSAAIVGITTAIGSLVPLIPFTLNTWAHMTFNEEIIGAIIVCAIALFGVGAYQALSLVGSWWKSGIRMVLIGLSAAFIGYIFAKLIQG